MKRTSKLNNQPTMVYGKLFDSGHEAKRYMTLRAWERDGKIKNLETQKKYVLIDTQREPSTIGPRGGIHLGELLEAECSYYADFVYEDANGVTHVEDAKGFRTEVYKIKKKLMLQRYGIRIEEV